ncbi:MAG: pyridoxamine 5'-phosphate oxidase [Nitrospirales bacterium]|nr:pyridoxamine 5'-phosphate oxidase [Nitrospirales bacterium]
MNQNFTKLAFTDTVKGFQEQHGSRQSYAKMEQSGDQFVLTDREKGFLEAFESFYLATVGADGWPYVQFRGGPPGFLHVLDETTLGFADFRGNRQYISVGNLTDTQRASLILVDYSTQQRLKIWAEAEIQEAADAPDLTKQLTPENYNARIERVILLHIRAYDWNCPQHITPRYTLAQIANEITHLNPQIIKSCCPDE